MTQIYSMPVTRLINYKYSQLAEDFQIYSDVLGQQCILPAGFIMDWESIPFIRGTGKVGGLIHDFLCRRDSTPVVTKKIAADVYLEFLRYRQTSYVRRYIKYWAVKFATGYFHKHSVLATYEELTKGL